MPGVPPNVMINFKTNPYSKTRNQPTNHMTFWLQAILSNPRVDYGSTACVRHGSLKTIPGKPIIYFFKNCTYVMFRVVCQENMRKRTLKCWLYKARQST